jgi:tetratricopeptide (TPR) repeat protein
MDDNDLMDNEDNPEAPLSPTDEQFFVDDKRSNIGLIWRIVVVVAALAIVVILAYPFIQQRLPDSNRDASSPPDAEAIAPAPALTLEANPDTAEGWFELGKTYYKAGQWAQAVVAFQKTIELDPNYQAAYANLGAAYHRQDQLDLAATQYEKALDLSPDDGEVVYNLAAIYIQQATQSGGRPDPNLLNQAIEQLNRALELSPDTAEPYFGLGVAYAALNQREEAIQAFETFLDRDSGQDPRASEEAQRYLQLLRGQ